MKNLDISNEKEDSYIIIEYSNEKTNFSIEFNNIDYNINTNQFNSIFKFFENQLIEKLPLRVDYQSDSGVFTFSVIDSNSNFDLGYMFNIEKIESFEDIKYYKSLLK